MRTPTHCAAVCALRALAALAALLVLGAAPALSLQTPEGRDTPILVGDVIRITLWREPDWNGDFPVDQFGVAALPLVGDVAVAGMTQSGLKQMLRQAFSREIHDPVLQVVVLKRIRVLGEVRSPGIYILEPTASVADALATAGGRSPGGRADRVQLRRSGETLTTNVLVDTRLAELAIQTGDELSVPERSWVSRNAGTVLGTTAGLLGVLAAVLVR